MGFTAGLLADKASLEQKLAETKEKLEVAIEFITDCSVSHEESRYKYRAQMALKKINGEQHE